MQNHVQQGSVNFNLAVVINKPQFSKLVHESTDARSRRADHFRECLLADLRQDRLGLAFLAKICKQQKGPRQTFFARVEQLIDQILLDTTVASQEVRNKQFGKGRLFVDYANDLCLGYARDRTFRSTASWIADTSVKPGIANSPL